MRIHLITVVGAYVDVLHATLAHYQALGVDETTIQLMLNAEDDALAVETYAIAARLGCRVTTAVRGPWLALQERVWRDSMRAHPDEWCLLADQDELQVYPDDLRSLLAYCDRKGYEYITGAFVDRIAADGGFPPLRPDVSLVAQFPLGGFLSWPLLGSDPRKVVAAKGRVPLVRGQHLARSGVPCPIDELFVPVHHFKWTAGVVERLRARVALCRNTGESHGVESERFLAYHARQGGRIDLTDARFLIAPCEPSYPHWPRVTGMAASMAGVSARQSAPRARVVREGA